MKNQASSYIPIDISLGSDARESIILALLAVMPFVFKTIGRCQRESLLIGGAILLISLNPWCAQAVFERTNRVLSWRWLWGAPIPIIVALLLSMLSAKWNSGGNAAVGICLTVLFLCCGAWTCRGSNGNFHFAISQWKVPPEYAEVEKIATLLPTDNVGVMTLAPGGQAAWLPIVRPGLPLVMGGHTQLRAYGTLMGRREYADRIALQSVVEWRPSTLSPDSLARAIDALRVTHVIAPRYKRENEQFAFLQHRENTRIIGTTDHFFVLHIGHL